MSNKPNFVENIIEQTAGKVLDAGVDKVQDFLDDGKMNKSNVAGGKVGQPTMVMGPDGTMIPAEASGLEAGLNSVTGALASATDAAHGHVEGALGGDKKPNAAGVANAANQPKHDTAM